MPTPTLPSPPALMLVENEDDYHAQSKCGAVMSSGMLKKFRDCPYAYHLATLGETEERDTAAYRFGRAAHKMILEGKDAFAATYHVGGPINEKTGKPYGVETQAYAAWLDEHGLTKDRIITPDEGVTLSTMAAMVRSHTEAAAALDFGWPELVLRHDLHGVPCQIRMDWLTHDAEGNYCIIDLKTTDDITYFESDAKRYGYPQQFAFYCDVFEAAVGSPAHVAVIVAEKKAPFRVGLWHFPKELLVEFSAINREALEHYKNCQEQDRWPTGYEAIREFTLSRR